jgi:hypothetical protein
VADVPVNPYNHCMAILIKQPNHLHSYNMQPILSPPCSK